MKKKKSRGPRAGDSSDIIAVVRKNVRSAAFVAGHALILVAWIVVNTRLVPGLRPFDPYPFVMLAMIASVEALFLSAFILVSQARMMKVSERRAHLTLQMNLLTEHELTQVLMIVDAIEERVGASRPDPTVAERLKQEVNPERVVREIDHIERAPR